MSAEFEHEGDRLNIPDRMQMLTMSNMNAENQFAILPEGSSGFPLARLQSLATEYGFASIGVADLNLSERRSALEAWSAAGYAGTMDWFGRSLEQRLEPRTLVPEAQVALMVTMHYAPQDPAWVETAWHNLKVEERAYVARYALGRDYHKVVKSRLQQLMQQIAREVQGIVFRVFADSAPIMEVELAQRAGLGWRGKNTLLLNSRSGSMFFLGTVLTNLTVLTPSEPQYGDASSAGPEQTGVAPSHCGRCTACIDICPTQAFVAPYVLNASRCISYLTIEHSGSIPEQLRPLLGNRIYGCDDCQLICPWNKFAREHEVPDFASRNRLDSATLVELFSWSEQEFLQRMEGSPIRRIGHERWIRNLSIAIGNIQGAEVEQLQLLIGTLSERLAHDSQVVREHVTWAIQRLTSRLDAVGVT